MVVQLVTTPTTITMRINLAGEVVKLLLLLPQSVLQVKLLLLQPGHLSIVIIKPSQGHILDLGFNLNISPPPGQLPSSRGRPPPSPGW